MARTLSVFLGVAVLWASPLHAEPKVEHVAVMSLQGQGLPAETVTILDSLLVQAVTAVAPYKVISMQDVNAMLGREQLRDAMGCNDVTCSAEIGGALGVRFLLTGTASKLGTKMIVALSLIDTQKQEVVDRARIGVTDEEDLYAWAVESAARKLFGLTPKPKPQVGASAAPADAMQLASPKPWRDYGVAKAVWDEYVGYCTAAQEASADCLIFERWHASEPKMKQTYLAYFRYRASELDDGRRAMEFDEWFDETQLGKLSIESEPPGASVQLNGKPVGVTPARLTGLDPGTYEVALSLAAHVDERQQVSVSAGRLSQLRVQMHQAGKLAVSSPTPGAKIVINGEAHAGPEVRLVDLPDGRYVVRVEAPGHLPQERAFTVERGTDAQEAFTLVRVGTLAVQSSPPGATVYLDGEPVGTTPALLEVPRAGDHRVRLALEDHLERATAVSIRDQETTKVALELRSVGSETALTVRRWISLGAAVALAGGGVALLAARRDLGSIEQKEYAAYQAATTPQTATEQRAAVEAAMQQSNTMAIAGYVLLGAVVPVAIWSIIEWLPVGYDDASVGVVPLEGGAVGILGGRF